VLDLVLLTVFETGIAGPALATAVASALIWLAYARVASDLAGIRISSWWTVAPVITVGLIWMAG
jgi:hypothetical protein